MYKLFIVNPDGTLENELPIGAEVALRKGRVGYIVDKRSPSLVHPLGWVILQIGEHRYGGAPDRIGAKFAVPSEYNRARYRLYRTEPPELAGRQVLPGDCLGKVDGWHVWLEAVEPPSDDEPQGLILISVGRQQYYEKPERFYTCFAGGSL